ncbi:MAG TPA: hypothetical protein VME68_07405 [Acidobacteriaceae bacterium]|nr:hypothetical protein [Acidobacteriaceae bacterium]
MKKLVSASVMLLGVCSAMIVFPPAFAQGADQASGQAGQGSTCSPSIKDPAEYNAYTNATSQSSAQAKAQAIEAFLTQYPNSVAKASVLQDLMSAYETYDAAKTLDAAKRLLQVDPNNLRALTFVVYLEHQQANGNQAALDQAAADANKGLNSPKDACTTQADYDKVKDAATPIFYSAIGADDVAKKDYKGAIDAYTKELQSYKDPAQTTVVPGLLDTIYLGQAYLQEDPKDIKNAVWFLTRAAQFAKPPYQGQIEAQAEYWYKKFHCAQNDGACQAKPDGLQAIQQAAAVPANIFPPASYNPTPAPPPPTPQQIVQQVLATTTPDQLGLADKEYVLANGNPDDQQKVWATMNGVTAEIPGVVVSATPDSVQLAVTPDNQQSNKADFTINMKTPLKEVPKQGDKVTYIATFDSYTQNPPMIILKDGELKAVPKAPVHHTPHHSTSSQR